ESTYYRRCTVRFPTRGCTSRCKGDEIIPVINSIQKDYDLTVATQDWHPNNHKSFASQHVDKLTFDVIELNGLQQVLWPDHCIQGSYGAELSEKLETD